MDHYRLKQFVDWVLQQSDCSIGDSGSESEELGRRIKEMWRESLQESRIEKLTQEDPPRIYITSNLSTAGKLKVSLSKAGLRQESIVYSLEDFYAVGPLRHIDQQQYETERYMWMMNHMGYDHYYSNGLHHIAAMKPILENIPDHKLITIWAGSNAHDYIFSRLVLHLLRGVKAEIRILNPEEEYKRLLALNLLPVVDKELDHTVLHQLQTEDVSQLIQRIQGDLLSEEDRARYASEWRDISGRSEMLRVLIEGKLLFLAEDAYDSVIMEVIHEQCNLLHRVEDKYIHNEEYVSAGLLIDPILERYPELMSAHLISYRFRSLIANKKLEFVGVPNETHQYYLKPAKV
ncbi:DUF1835 domain-containing protein [Paenibacillus sp. PDC88]|uniref:DUF1835 domain-containing protein n=1 Tax=Paenibacillus sp. PDC88 TaxID=1884375 RepID=UPI00089B46F8|nr:DUF1835 domain-containing protein [Paenibacillus sp. PDC88]SDW66993.1 Protein of unknown function [Paenibacillus sp. PDC88]